MSAREAFSRPRVRSASRSGSRSLAMRAVRMAPPADSEDVADDRRQLEMSILEHLLDALRVTRRLTNKLGTGARQVPQVADGWWRHKAAANEPVSEQIGEPGRIIDVR